MTQTTISMILMRKKMMNKLIAVLALAFLLVACAKQAAPEPANVQAPEAVVTPASDLPDISGDIAGVDALDQDLSTDDLNNVESDIDQVNW